MSHATGDLLQERDAMSTITLGLWHYYTSNLSRESNGVVKLFAALAPYAKVGVNSTKTTNHGQRTLAIQVVHAAWSVSSDSRVTGY